MGIPIWVKREPEPVLTPQTESLSWSALEQTVKACTLCPLHQTRLQTVFGSGDPTSPILFIGEGPGANEDRQGLPFVGRAGQLLDAMLMAINLDRKNIYIANIVKCRPPHNRDPSPDEIAACTPYLRQQIKHIQPKLIVALGRVAAQYLLKSSVSMNKLRGHVHTLSPENLPVMVTYHPAYLLRNPLDKAQALEDLYRIRAYAGT
ncbi:MAG: uracil-DNA glycosylase [Gammaproteobacteria bacterium]|nr:uracil-DNA glycosylase [Gammaproteobacteria bacterium]